MVKQRGYLTQQFIMTTCYNFIMTTCYNRVFRCHFSSCDTERVKGYLRGKFKSCPFMHTTVKARSCQTLVLWLDNVDFNDGA